MPKLEDMVTSVLAPPERRLHNPVRRDAATFLETSDESRGTHTLIEIQLAPGGGCEPHRHVRLAERFTVVAGTLHVRIGDREVELRAGQTAAAPYGALHSFANRSEAPVTFRVEFLPGDPASEQAIQIAYGLAADGLVRDNGLPRRLSDLAVVVQLGQTRFSGPVAVLQPLFGLLARRADRKGAQRRLVERYCRF